MTSAWPFGMRDTLGHRQNAVDSRTLTSRFPMPTSCSMCSGYGHMVCALW